MPSVAPPVFLSWACWCSEEAAFQVRPADSAAQTAGLIVAAAAAVVGIVVAVAADILDSVVAADTADSTAAAADTADSAAAAADTADLAGPDSLAAVVEGVGLAHLACYYQRLD